MVSSTNINIEKEDNALLSIFLNSLFARGRCICLFSVPNTLMIVSNTLGNIDLLRISFMFNLTQESYYLLIRILQNVKIRDYTETN